MGDEVTEAMEFIAQYLAVTAAQNSPSRQQARPEAERRVAAWQSYCQMLLCSNEFLYVD
jgi:hypothetical protein